MDSPSTTKKGNIHLILFNLSRCWYFNEIFGLASFSFSILLQGLWKEQALIFQRNIFLFIYPDFHCLFHCNVTVRHFEASGRRYFNVLDCRHICQFYYNDSVTHFEKSGRWYFNRKFRLSPFVYYNSGRCYFNRQFIHFCCCLYFNNFCFTFWDEKLFYYLAHRWAGRKDGFIRCICA